MYLTFLSNLSKRKNLYLLSSLNFSNNLYKDRHVKNFFRNFLLKVSKMGVETTLIKTVGKYFSKNSRKMEKNGKFDVTTAIYAKLEKQDWKRKNYIVV